MATGPVIGEHYWVYVGSKVPAGYYRARYLGESDRATGKALHTLWFDGDENYCWMPATAKLITDDDYVRNLLTQ